jgi:lipopolysaccharide/colanic/teichoic acid biosynthesis glycosyltransferase
VVAGALFIGGGCDGAGLEDGVLIISIRWASPGPAFFRQKRIGLQGKIFWMWKFRTMIPMALNSNRSKRLTA